MCNTNTHNTTQPNTQTHNSIKYTNTNTPRYTDMHKKSQKHSIRSTDTQSVSRGCKKMVNLTGTHLLLPWLVPFVVTKQLISAKIIQSCDHNVQINQRSWHFSSFSNTTDKSPTSITSKVTSHGNNKDVPVGFITFFVSRETNLLCLCYLQSVPAFGCVCVLLH